MSLPELSLSTMLESWVTDKLESVHTCLPAKIESYNATTRKVTVLPLVKARFSNGAIISFKKIDGVPVQFPSGQNWGIHAELVPGDVGIILISEASLGQWLLSEGKAAITPEDHTRFSLQDAIFIPGVYPWNATPKDIPSTGLFINYKGSSGHFTDDGIAFKGNVTIDGTLTTSKDITAQSGNIVASVGDVSAMSNTIHLSTHIHPHPMGPTSPTTGP